MSNLQTPSTSHPEESFNDFYHEVNTINKFSFSSVNDLTSLFLIKLKTIIKQQSLLLFC